MKRRVAFAALRFRFHITSHFFTKPPHKKIWERLKFDHKDDMKNRRYIFTILKACSLLLSFDGRIC